MWVLIGIGCNDLRIPALVWSDFDVALARCKELLGEPTHEVKGEMYWPTLSKDDVQKMYTHYYSGCGECSSAILHKVEEGKPFVHWDLD